MRTVAIVCQKGGSGKTTLALHLATAAAYAGMQSCLIDLDPQASAAAWGDWRGDFLPEVITCPPVRLGYAIKKAGKSGTEFIVIDTPPHDDMAAREAVGRRPGHRSDTATRVRPSRHGDYRSIHCICPQTSFRAAQRRAGWRHPHHRGSERIRQNPGTWSLSGPFRRPCRVPPLHRGRRGGLGGRTGRQGGGRGRGPLAMGLPSSGHAGDSIEKAG